MTNHPLSLISPKSRPAIFAVLLIVTLIFMAILNITGDHLRTYKDGKPVQPAPLGIISYELAGTEENAGNILNSWDNEDKVYAGFNLGFDYLWMIFYSTTIALGLVWTADALNLTGRLSTAVNLLAWGQWLAALLDALENDALLTMLFNEPATPWPQIAFLSAVIKFALVILGILVVLGGAIFYRLRPKQQ